MNAVVRGPGRNSKPDIFLSHSYRDRIVAADLACDLNFCSTDVWLDQWELQIGQSLTDEIAKAMAASRYIAILITGNYNKSVWTKAEYKKALSREQREGQTVMLPLLLGEAELPDFLEDRIYVDLRTDYFSGLLRIAGMVHGLSEFRIAQAIAHCPPKRRMDIWLLLDSIGFEPYLVVGQDDFGEMLKHGGSTLLDAYGKIRDGYARFDPGYLLQSPAVSSHVKALVKDIC